MKSEWEIPRVIGRFMLYYAGLQICHLILLTRAGYIYLETGKMPFPALPPYGGWPEALLPVLLGMGILDAAAAGLAIYVSVVYIRKNLLQSNLVIISLTIALSSALLFCAATIPTRAWQVHPLGYGILVVGFTPLSWFYYLLIGGIGRNKH